MKLLTIVVAVVTLGRVDARAAGPTTAPAAVVRVARIGDSVTYGFNIHDREHNAYPVQLRSDYPRDSATTR